MLRFAERMKWTRSVNSKPIRANGRAGTFGFSWKRGRPKAEESGWKTRWTCFMERGNAEKTWRLEGTRTDGVASSREMDNPITRDGYRTNTRFGECKQRRRPRKTSRRGRPNAQAQVRRPKVRLRRHRRVELLKKLTRNGALSPAAAS